jgi:hypothetical protein
MPSVPETVLSGVKLTQKASLFLPILYPFLPFRSEVSHQSDAVAYFCVRMGMTKNLKTTKVAVATQ